MGWHTEIVTSKRWKGNQDLFELAERLGISKDKIIFSKNKPDDLQGFDLHFDDDKLEVENINVNTHCQAILYNN